MKLSCLEEKHNYMNQFENITKCHFNIEKLFYNSSLLTHKVTEKHFKNNVR